MAKAINQWPIQLKQLLVSTTKTYPKKYIMQRVLWHVEVYNKWSSNSICKSWILASHVEFSSITMSYFKHKIFCLIMSNKHQCNVSHYFGFPVFLIPLLSPMEKGITEAQTIYFAFGYLSLLFNRRTFIQVAKNHILYNLSNYILRIKYL